MKVVVTGGGGYVGYHVGWVIARGGHEVTLLDIAAPDPEWATTAPEALRDALPDGGSWVEGGRIVNTCQNRGGLFVVVVVVSSLWTLLFRW